jgi:hypothetical protein
MTSFFMTSMTWKIGMRLVAADVEGTLSVRNARWRRG